MSFLKITDPKRRDLVVKEFLKLKNNIKQDDLNERMGNISLQQDLSKLYKPITESQRQTQESIVKELTPLRDGIAALPGAITAAAPPVLPAPATGDVSPGDIAQQYVRSEKSQFGIHYEPSTGKFKMGKSLLML